MLVGLVGHPSSGKSTFFKAATLIDVAIASYPFTTIEPNRGMGFVRVKCVDRELNTQCNPRTGYCKNGIRYCPAEILDVAGLVPGAHEGKGLGNKFLSDLNMADALINIIDISGTTNEKGEAVTGYDPVNDIIFLEKELDYWYADILKKGWAKFARMARQKLTEIDEFIVSQMSSLGVRAEMIEPIMDKLKLNADPTLWSDDDILNLAKEFRMVTKPIVYACNKIDMPNGKANYEKLKAQFPDRVFVPCSAESEMALREAAKKGLIEYNPGDSDFKILKPNEVTERQKAALEFIRKNILQVYGSTGVQQILDIAVFDVLKWLAIFPGGVHKLGDKEGRILPDVFFLPFGSTALDFANKIHSDIGKGFLYAIDVRTKQRIGKDYKLKNRDIIEIISAAK